MTKQPEQPDKSVLCTLTAYVKGGMSDCVMHTHIRNEDIKEIAEDYTVFVNLELSSTLVYFQKTHSTHGNGGAHTVLGPVKLQ
jgi:hypothetical protein